MRPTTPLLLALTLIVAACGGERDESADASAGATPAMSDPSTQATAPRARNVTLSSMNSSGVTADVTVTAVGDSTSVAVNLKGAAANATLPEHIHSGTCDAQGSVVAPLASLTTDGAGAAEASTIVNIPFSTVTNGQHYIQVHGPDGKPTACGNITG